MSIDRPEHIELKNIDTTEAKRKRLEWSDTLSPEDIKGFDDLSSELWKKEGNYTSDDLKGAVDRRMDNMISNKDHNYQNFSPEEKVRITLIKEKIISKLEGSPKDIVEKYSRIRHTLLAELKITSLNDKKCKKILNLKNQILGEKIL
jgi:hypothetical protein